MIGTILDGRYRLQSKLGSGGMSTVYLAQDSTLDRPVAVKVLHREISGQQDQLQRFRQEARTAARLSHPNVVAVIDAGEDHGAPYIVFECIEGQTLKQRIQRGGALPVNEAVAYAIEIGRGLAAAHARRLVHRDVKPQNVLIDAEGRAKVTDFGIARSLETGGTTATGRVLGTTDYVSPEQAMGRDVDERSDVYSLGVVLFEMLTGRVPFAADSQVAVAMKHVNEPMPDVRQFRPEVSASLAAVLDRATHKDPDRRHDSIPELLDDLEETLQVEAARSGGTTGEATAVLESVRPKRRRPGRASGAGIVMGLIGIGLIVAALVFGGAELRDGSGGGSEIPLEEGSVTDFDPFGDDGQEHPEDLDLAIDSNPTGTAWTTETYISDDFSGAKEGAGIYVDAGEPVEVDAVEIRTPDGGWDVEIRAAPGATSAPENLDGWRIIARGEGVSTKEKLNLVPRVESQFYLVWVTSLVDPEGSANFKAEISNIRLLE